MVPRGGGARRRWVRLAALAGVLLAAPAGAQRFDFEALVARIEAERLADVASVLGRLPFELRSSYTLVYAGGGLQGASREHPRAVLFGEDARLVITFNGHPAQARYEHLEILHYRDEREAFELRVIAFEDGRVRVSPPNPPVCLGCHGRSPRPLWGSYGYGERASDHWPGVYGSSHDAPARVPAEGEAFVRFRSRAGAHERYRHLRLHHPDSAWYPYGTGPFEHRFRPNNRLGNLLARLNARRLSRLAADSAFLRRYTYTVWSWLAGCADDATRGLSDALENHFAAAFPAARHAALHARAATLSADHRVWFMLEKLLTGLDVDTWNLSIVGSAEGERFSTGIVTIDRLVTAGLLERTAPADALLQAYYLPRDARHLYDGFAAGYYRRNVEPGGVGRAYDSLGAYFDEARLTAACPQLRRAAAAEGVAPP